MVSRHRLLHAAGEVGRYTLLIIFAFVFLAPFVWIAFWALKTEMEIGAAPFSPPINPHWDNLARTWTTGRYSRYLPNTLIYATTISVGVCFFSCLAGYALAKIRFPGRQMLFSFFLVGLMVPFFALMIPLFLLVRDFHILGTRWALIVPGIALGLPFGIFLMRAFFLALPDELVDAAKIDGCSEWSAFWRVMLPLAWPGLTTLVVFEFLGTWNMFVEPLVLVQRDELRPVGLAILFFQSRYNIDRGMVAAGVMMTILPVILVYIALQRKFIEGITAGALK
jgi:ABC-type glycerol-3-phosphate transport system permease component